MALPEGLFYSLKELAEKWGQTENKLIQWGATKKLVFSMNFAGYLGEEGHSGKREATPDGKSFYLPRRLNLGADIIRLIMTHGEAPIYFTMAGVTYWPIDPPPGTTTLLHGKDCKVTKADLVVGSDIVTQMEAKHTELLNSCGEQEEPTGRPREAEKPLSTMKEIAAHCAVHVDTIKKWREKHKDFPASPIGGGRVTALPSELNAWMLRHTKK